MCLVVNSRKTRNLQTLMLRVVGVVQNAEDEEQQRMAANGICFLKLVIKCILEKLPGPDFLTFMDGYSLSGHTWHDRRPG